MRPVLQSGISDFLPQPLQVRNLLRAVEQCVEEPEGAASGSGAGAGSILAVVGAKGGVGKSTIATNLAAALARDTDLKVLLVDLDTRFGDVALMLDIESRFTIADLAAGLESLDRQTFHSALLSHPSGVQVLPAPRHPAQWREISADEIRAVCEFGSRLYDYVILDTPGTFNEVVATALDIATDVLVVSSLDLASVKDTAAMLDLLETEGYPSERLRLLINDVGNARTIGVRDVQDVFGREVEWDIPYDVEVARAANSASPWCWRGPMRARRSDSQPLAAIWLHSLAAARGRAAARPESDVSDPRDETT